MRRLLVIDSGSEDARSYILAKARSLGLSLVIARKGSLTWEKAYADGGSLDVDLGQPDEVLAAAERMHRSHPFDGVFTYSERYVVLAARVAERLGLPGIPVGAAELTRHKDRFTALMLESGLGAPRSVPVSTEAAVGVALAAIGYPAIIKPSNGFESRGVLHLPSPESLPAALETLNSFRLDGAAPPRFVVQEYVDGPEVSVEGLVHNRRFYPLMVTEKQLGSLPYFEEIGHMQPSAVAAELRDELYSLVGQAVRVAGLDTCAIHAEVRLGRQGPRLLEMACRLGGDFIPYLVHLSTGVDMVAGAIQLALGEAPRLPPARRRAAAVRFIVPEQAGRIQAIAGWEAVVTHEGVHLARLDAAVGDEVQLPPQSYCTRLGAVIVAGPDRATVADRMASALSHLELIVENGGVLC